MNVNLANYSNQDYDPGAGQLKRFIWYCMNVFIFDSWLLPVSSIKCMILRLFGASIGSGVVIKPRVNIKYPWFLQIHNHCWIGEGVWIDNLTRVTIGHSACISQGAYLMTGNHDYKDPAFGLMVREIIIGDGVWVGAHAIVCPGVRMAENTVLTAGSVLQKNTSTNGIYQGNPAKYVRERRISV